MKDVMVKLRVPADLMDRIKAFGAAGEIDEADVWHDVEYKFQSMLEQLYGDPQSFVDSWSYASGEEAARVAIALSLLMEDRPIFVDYPEGQVGAEAGLLIDDGPAQDVKQRADAIRLMELRARGHG